MPLLKNERIASLKEEREKEDDDEEDDDLLIFPITDLNEFTGSSSDGAGYPQNTPKRSFEPTRKGGDLKPLMTLKQRRRSLLTGNALTSVPDLLTRMDSGVHMDMLSPYGCASLAPKERWKMAVQKIHTMKDPWKKFDLDKFPAERATRHRYNALTRKWIADEIIVRMTDEPFNRGAMRSCYRLKKLNKIRPEHKKPSLETIASTLVQNHDWSAQSHNCVAKKYMEAVERDVYFHDVQLQMDAKLWGEEYNRHRPPKQVDIIQMAVLEFKDRPGRPLCHLENFIEGDYKKYNSNSGFVEDHWRMTPQAFSHFTFERSNHQLMVVDIQGVGDLYTDPQIHTFDGIQYGDGNLGTRGMALFFHSHSCNSICHSFGLSKFDLYRSEMQDISSVCSGRGEPNNVQATRVRGLEGVVSLGTSPCFPPSYDESFTSTFFSAHLLAQDQLKTSMPSAPPLDDEDEDEDDDNNSKDEGIASPLSGSFSRKHKAFLSGSESSATVHEEEERRMLLRRASRPSCVEVEMQNRTLEAAQGDSVLGLLHHELAKYHEIGRFVRDGQEVEVKAALFHEQHAADLGVVEAALTLAYIQLGMPHDILSSISVQNEDREVGFEFMKMAARGGDRKAMLFLGKAFETGFGIPGDSSPSAGDAVFWYQRALENLEQEADSSGFDSTMDDPPYQIKATMAKLYSEGGRGLQKDATRAGDLYQEAAEAAMEAMKGKLANRYYALSEEAYACSEE